MIFKYTNKQNSAFESSLIIDILEPYTCILITDCISISGELYLISKNH